MVRSLDRLGHQRRVADHTLDAIEHETSLLATDEDGLPLLGEGRQGLGGVLPSRNSEPGSGPRPPRPAPSMRWTTRAAASWSWRAPGAARRPMWPPSRRRRRRARRAPVPGSPTRSRPPPRRSTCHRRARSPWPARGRPDRGNNQEAPLSRERPRRAKIMESRAVSLQTQRSQPKASERPAPTATPSTLAMVGLVTRCSASATSPSRRMRTRPARLASVAGPLGSPRSAPEQKAPPGAGQHHHAVVGRVLHRDEGLEQLGQHLGVGGVLALGTVHRDRDDAVLALDNEGLHGLRPYAACPQNALSTRWSACLVSAATSKRMWS